MGNDIVGETDSDWFGNAVALSADGNRMVTGAFFNSEIGEDGGQVRVFELTGNTWTQMGNDFNADAAFDRCGHAVAISDDGSRIAFSLPYNDNNGNFDPGQVRVFEWTGSNWVQMGNNIDGENFGDQFGQSLAMSADGSRLIAGAHNNTDAGLYAGHARVFKWDGNNWIQMGTDIDGVAAEDEFGWAVAMDAIGNRIAVSARGNDGSASNAGHVRIFEWNNTDWVQVGAAIDGENTEDYSGQTVALNGSGSRVAIGSMNNDEVAEDAGNIRVFEWSAGSWTQIGSDIDGHAEDELLGRRIAFSPSGNMLAAQVWPSSVRIFLWNGTSWIQSGDDFTVGSQLDGFGGSLAFSADAKRLAIGAPFYNGNTGVVRVYEDFTSSIKDLKANEQLTCFPNPTNGLIHLHGLENAVVKITDIHGNFIKKMVFNGQPISLRNLPNGVYFISVQSGDEKWVNRIIKVAE